MLNIAAVGLALAAITSAVLRAILGELRATALAAGASTWLVGTLWAALLRWRTVGRSFIHVGWALSVPLAMLNAALTCGALMRFGLPWTRLPAAHDPGYRFGDCRCCPGGQDAFRATLDHAGARRLLGLPPEPTPATPPTDDLPPARTRPRIPS